MTFENLGRVFAPTLLLVPTVGPDSVKEYEKIARIMAFIFTNHKEFMVTGANVQPFDFCTDIKAIPLLKLNL